MVLELLELFHLGYVLHVFVGSTILETSLHAARRLSGLIKMRSADLERVLWGSAGDIARQLAVAFQDSCSNTFFREIARG
jgi:hypothetical protein